MEKYSALIIDIKKSKKYNIEIRNELQGYLTKCIDLLNSLFHDKITCDVTYSVGDDLQR